MKDEGWPKVTYLVVEDWDLADFQTQVQKRLDEGWQLQGGCSSDRVYYPPEDGYDSDGHVSVHYVQAMTGSVS